MRFYKLNTKMQNEITLLSPSLKDDITVLSEDLSGDFIIFDYKTPDSKIPVYKILTGPYKNLSLIFYPYEAGTYLSELNNLSLESKKLLRILFDLDC